MEPDTNPQPIPPIQPSIPEKSKPPILLWFLIFALVGLASYLGYQNWLLRQQISSVKPTPAPSVLPTTTPDPMANWKTYTNPVRNYAIKYPLNWSVDASKAETDPADSRGAELLISNGEYRITILWPSAFGPGICVFDDESRDGAPEIASFCEGDYKEFITVGNQVHRRLIKAETLSDRAQWEVYTKDQVHFVTVPPIRYQAPLAYDIDTILLMDQILSSFTPTTKNN